MFYKQLMPSHVYILHTEFHQCKYSSRCNQMWLAITLQILNPMPLKSFNTLRPRQDGGHFPDDVFICIFLNENARISIKISLRFVPKGPINNIPALIQIMAWRRPGDKQLSEPMMVKLPTHICVTRPQWVKVNYALLNVNYTNASMLVSSCKWKLNIVESSTHTMPLDFIQTL